MSHTTHVNAFFAAAIVAITAAVAVAQQQSAEDDTAQTYVEAPQELAPMLKEEGRFYRSFVMVWDQARDSNGNIYAQANAYPYPAWPSPGIYNPETMPNTRHNEGEHPDNMSLSGWAGALTYDAATDTYYEALASLCVFADAWNFFTPTQRGGISPDDIELAGYSTAPVDPILERLSDMIPPRFSIHNAVDLTQFVAGPIATDAGPGSLYVQAFTCSRPSLPGDDPIKGQPY